MTRQSFGLGLARPLTVLAAFAAIPGIAAAQEADSTGFRAEMFDPVPTQHTGVLNLRRPAVLDHLSVGGGIFAHFEEDPASTAGVPDNEVGGTAVDRQLTTEIGIGIGLFGVTQLSLAAPVFSAQWGRNMPDAEEGGFPYGDTRASLDFLIVDPERANGYGVSATVTGRFPTGEVSELSSDGKVRVEPALAFGKSWDAGHELFVNGSLSIGSPQTAPRFAYSDAGTIGGGVGGVLNLAGSRFDLIGTVYGRMSVVDDVIGTDGARVENTARAAEGLGGLRIRLPADLILQAGAGAQLNDGLPAPDYRIFTSRHWAWIKAEPVVEPEPEPEPEPIPEPIPEPEPEPEPEPVPVVEPEPEPEPAPPEPRIVEQKIEFSESIQFETGSATIREESFNVLTQIANVVKRYPQITKIQIEGHTDDVGNDSANKRLSQERAKSVREYMVSQELPADRFTAVGFGESRPVAPNDTEEGKAKNRRVEFVILEVDGKPVKEGQAIIQETVEEPAADDEASESE